jgi:SHS2 domain-containing protein
VRAPSDGVYRWVEHTSEVELEIEAASERDVFADAVAAIAELLAIGGEGEETRTVSATAGDRSALFAAFLDELAFLVEDEGFEPVRLESLELDSDSLLATVRGRLGQPPPLIKGVTYHRLAFEPAASGYRARAVLDV